MEKPGKVCKPISSHDTKALTEYCEKNIPNPGDSILWKFIKCGDYLMEHKNVFVHWASVPFVFLVIVPFVFSTEIYYWVRQKITGRGYWG